MNRILVGLVMAALMPLFGMMSGPGLAADANPVKERQKMMRAVGKAMKISVKMLRGELKYDANAVSGAMKTMNDVAGRFPDFFPKGSDMENAIMDFDQESDARPEIWAHMDDFKMKAAALKKASAVALKVVDDKAAFGAALNNVGAACKGCHEKYKAVRKD